MTIPIMLVVYAALVSVVAPRVLARTRWIDRAPRWGVVAWVSCVLAVLASVALLAVTAAVPVDEISFDVSHVLHACAGVLQNRFAVRDGQWVGGVGLLTGAAAVVLLIRALVWRTATLAAGRRRQRDLLDLVARDRDALGAHVLDHDVRMAYCVPGGRGRVVVTTSARRSLLPDELHAVVAHERGHLSGRHDLVVFGAEVAATAFPWSRFFRTARAELAGLVEMLADDVAVRAAGRGPLTTALVNMSTHQTPPATLGMAAGATTQRVLRLADVAPPPSLRRRGALALASGVLVLAPWAIALAPAWAARAGFCPLAA